MWAMSSGPVTPVGKPGKFSMSVVSMSWPPGWSVVEDGSPSITSGLQQGARGVDRGGEAGRARAHDEDPAVLGHHFLRFTGRRWRQMTIPVTVKTAPRTP